MAAKLFKHTTDQMVSAVVFQQALTNVFDEVAHGYDFHAVGAT